MILRDKALILSSDIMARTVSSWVISPRVYKEFASASGGPVSDSLEAVW